MRTRQEWDQLEKVDQLRYWVEVHNSRGHAGINARRTSNEKYIIERSTIEDWHTAIVVNHPELSGDILDGSDPPDFVIDTKAGHKVSVELVEFVNEKLLQEIIELRRKGIDVTSHSSGFYERAQWDEKSFLTKLRSIISKKSTVYEHNDVWIDILLIHTAEPWLFENDVEKWLKNATICGHRNIKRIHFMMAYMPERKPRHPLFQVS